MKNILKINLLFVLLLSTYNGVFAKNIFKLNYDNFANYQDFCNGIEGFNFQNGNCNVNDSKNIDKLISDLDNFEILFKGKKLNAGIIYKSIEKKLNKNTKLSEETRLKNNIKKLKPIIKVIGKAIAGKKIQENIQKENLYNGVNLVLDLILKKSELELKILDTKKQTKEKKVVKEKITVVRAKDTTSAKSRDYTGYGASFGGNGFTEEERDEARRRNAAARSPEETFLSYMRGNFIVETALIEHARYIKDVKDSLKIAKGDLKRGYEGNYSKETMDKLKTGIAIAEEALQPGILEVWKKTRPESYRKSTEKIIENAIDNSKMTERDIKRAVKYHNDLKIYWNRVGYSYDLKTQKIIYNPEDNELLK